jgi:hypothetical protein
MIECTILMLRVYIMHNFLVITKKNITFYKILRLTLLFTVRFKFNFKKKTKKKKIIIFSTNTNENVIFTVSQKYK